MNEEWIKSDDLQWVRRIGEDAFEAINAYDHEENSFTVATQIVDLSCYKEEDLLNEIKYFGYHSLKEVKTIYGESWKQIVAECISENDFYTNSSKMDRASLIAYLKEHNIPEELISITS